LLFGILSYNDVVSGAGFSIGTNGTSNNCATSGTPVYTGLGSVGNANQGALWAMYCVVAAPGAYRISGNFSSPAQNLVWQAALATYRAASPAAPVTVTPVSSPTLSQWGIFAFALLLTGAAALRIGNKRSIRPGIN